MNIKDPYAYTFKKEASVDITIEIVEQITDIVKMFTTIAFKLNSSKSPKKISYQEKIHEINRENYNRDHYIDFIKNGCIEQVKEFRDNPFKFLKVDSWMTNAQLVIKKEFIIESVNILLITKEFDGFTNNGLEFFVEL